MHQRELIAMSMPDARPLPPKSPNYLSRETALRLRALLARIVSHPSATQRLQQPIDLRFVEHVDARIAQKRCGHAPTFYQRAGKRTVVHLAAAARGAFRLQHGHAAIRVAQLLQTPRRPRRAPGACPPRSRTAGAEWESRRPLQGRWEPLCSTGQAAWPAHRASTRRRSGMGGPAGRR